MKRILVVLTGGTIGSRPDGGLIRLDRDAGRSLVEAFRGRAAGAREDVAFEVIQPVEMFSEDMLPRRWGEIYGAVRGFGLDACDGVVMTHGTDTLAYTAAAMSFLFAGAGVPVALTASGLGPGRPGSDGHANFAAAVDFVAGSGLPGVFAVFRDRAGETAVYLGSRLLSADSVTDRYSSYMGVDFGRMRDGAFQPCESATNPSARELRGLKARYSLGEPGFGRGVACLLPYPGLNYAHLDFSRDRPAAVLHGLYHSSTACTGPPAENSVLEFAKRCRDSGIDLYVHDGRRLAGETYPSGRALLDLGARPLTGLSFEAALAKLNIAYSQDAAPPYDYMKENVFFEYAGKASEMGKNGMAGEQ
ncbi:MAG: asparaginase domain-containing protein [Clostridiales Family XIII bacterium]|jgi:L-asparaginase|nr:asparaginase domain-containing protein [Clostridiales Family XIII bacterium]